VIGIDAFTDYYDPAIKRATVAALEHPRYTLVEGDLNTLDLAATLAGADAVVHLAGQPGVRKSWGSEFLAYTRANIDATQRLLEAVVQHAPDARFVYASSSSVYGQAETYPTTEDMLPQPVSPYGVSKLAGEHLVGLYAESFAVRATSFRFFTVYGPRQRPDMAFTRFLGAVHRGEPVTVYGTGEQIRDFTFVGDIALALLAGIDTAADVPRVMNLSGGSSVSVNEVLDTIADVTGRTVDIQRLDAVRGDVFRTGGSSELALTALGWEPHTALGDGLRKQWEWIRSR
jgi:UDP-glucuronate 4-epimerase